MVYIILVTGSDKLCIFPWIFPIGEIWLIRPLDSLPDGWFLAWSFLELFLKKGLISWGKYAIICFCIKGILCPEEFFEQEV